MKVYTDTRITRPIDGVFDAMADARNEPTWNTRVSETTLTSEEPVRKSSRFRGVNRGKSYEAMITEYQRPSRLTFTVTGKSMDIVGTLRFSEVDGATQMTGAFDLQPNGIMALMLPFMSPAIRNDFPRQMTNFKHFCEARA